MASYSFTDDQETPRLTPAVWWIIALNVVIYFLQITIVLPVTMQRFLGFEVADLPLHWWKAFTYMFAHGHFWHLALNMYTLFLFGPRVEHQWTPWSFARFYLLCGLGAWLAHLLFFRNSLLIGASGAIYGVMLAYAMLWPDDELYLFWVVPVKVKTAVFILAVMNFLQGVQSIGGGGSGVAHFAHLGGMAFAWLYLKSPTTQSIGRLRQRISPVADVPDEVPRAIPRTPPRPRADAPADGADDVVTRSKALVLRPRSATPARTAAVVPGRAGRERKEKLDLVLDKISQKGLDSLTGEERKLLEEMSKELRGQ